MIVVPTEQEKASSDGFLKNTKTCIYFIRRCPPKIDSHSQPMPVKWATDTHKKVPVTGEEESTTVQV
jgi:hypothetical protein